ncbi:hypothetical protein KFL_003520120 [Klebsormidium nitens]|uniref:Uncharacterized protein n=1 Tax=Klebsormidium nitens TaxID=105231 RepID=A0A1Y1IA42_KLENI|nr:hypothetical protein KFL_003520120 [Klebsormidium nitens]|eukprot:GAQ87433.1 hypothetical protein KFL_003520120 [Klebsormidium nitens]
MAEVSQHVRNNSAIFNITRGERHPWDYDPLMSFRQVDSPDTRASLPIFTTAMSVVSASSSRRSSLSGSEVDPAEIRSQIGSEKGLSRSKRSSLGGVEVVTTVLKPKLLKSTVKAGRAGAKSGIPKPKEVAKKTAGLSSLRRTSKASSLGAATNKSRNSGAEGKQAPKKKKGSKEAPPEGNPLSPWTAKEDIISPLVFTSSPSKRKGLFIEIPSSTQLSSRSSFVGSQSVASDDDREGLDGDADRGQGRRGQLSDRSRVSNGQDSEHLRTTLGASEKSQSRGASRIGSSQGQSPVAASAIGSARSREGSANLRYPAEGSVHSSAVSERRRRSSVSLSHLLPKEERTNSVRGESIPADGLHSTRASSRQGSRHADEFSHRSTPRTEEYRDVRVSGGSSRAGLRDLEERGDFLGSSRASSLGEGDRKQPSERGASRLDTTSQPSVRDEFGGDRSVRGSIKGSPLAERDLGRGSSLRSDERLDTQMRSSRLDELRGAESLRSSPKGSVQSVAETRAEREERLASRASSYRDSGEVEERPASRASSYRHSGKETASRSASARADFPFDGEETRRTSRISLLADKEERSSSRAESSLAERDNSPRSVDGSTRARSSINAAIAAADLAVAAAMRGRETPQSDRTPSRTSPLALLETLAGTSPKSTRSASPASPKSKSRSGTPTGRAAQERKAQLLSSGRSSVSRTGNSGDRSPRSSGARSPLGSHSPRGRSPLANSREHSLLKAALTSPRKSFASATERGRSPSRDGTRRHTDSHGETGESSPRRRSQSWTRGTPESPTESRRSSRAREENESGGDTEPSSRRASSRAAKELEALGGKEGDEMTGRITPRKAPHSDKSRRESTVTERPVNRSRSPSVGRSRHSSIVLSPTRATSRASSPTGRRRSIATSPVATSPRTSSAARQIHSTTPKSPLGSVRRSFVAPTSPGDSLTSPRRPWGSAVPRSLPASPKGATHVSRFKEELSPKKRSNSVAGSPTRERGREDLSEAREESSRKNKVGEKVSAGENGLQEQKAAVKTSSRTGTPTRDEDAWRKGDAPDSGAMNNDKTPRKSQHREGHVSHTRRTPAEDRGLSDDLRGEVQELARALEKERQRVAFLEEELAASERFAKKLALELDEWKTKARQYETAALQAEGRIDYAKRKETELSELRQKQLKLENEADEWRQKYTRHRRVSMESEVAAAEKAAAQARREAEEAAALIQDDARRELKAAQDALQERDARARQLERELTSERGARAAAEADSASAKAEAAEVRGALQNQGLEIERARRASEDLEDRLRDEAQMRLGLVEMTEVRQLERALGDKEAELQRCKKKLAEDEKAAAETTTAHEAEIQALQDSLAASARALAHLAGGASGATSPREHGPVTNLDHHIRRVQRRISESEVTAARVEELENRVSDLDRALEARNEELKRVKTEQAEAAVAAGVESVELRRQFVEASEELTRVRKQLVDVQRASDTWQDKEQKLRGELRVVKEEKEKTNEELTAVQRQVRAVNEEATRVRGQLIELQGKEVVHREREEELRDETLRLRDELTTLREMLICLGDKTPEANRKRSPESRRVASDASGDAFATRAVVRSDVSDSEDDSRARARRASRRLDFDEVPVRDTDRSGDPDAAQACRAERRNGTERTPERTNRTYEDQKEVDLAWARHEAKRQAACLEALKGQLEGKNCELAEARIKLVEAKALSREVSALRTREGSLRREVEEAERERDELRRECAGLRARLKRDSWREEEQWGRRSPRSSLDRYSRRNTRKAFEDESEHSRCDSDCTTCEEDQLGSHGRRRRSEGRHAGQRARGSGRHEGVRELQERLARFREEKRELQSEMERMRKRQAALETELKTCRFESQESGEKVVAIREERRAGQEQLSVANEKLTRARRRVEELEAQVELLRAEVARNAGRHGAERGPELVAALARARRAEKELHETRGLVARLREETKKLKESSNGRENALDDMISMPFRFEGVITSPR